MTIAIIGAMEQEIALLAEKIENRTELTVANTKLFQGTFEGLDIVLVKSGIGKVNAAMATTILHERFQPELILNIGSAGGLITDLAIGDIVISDETIHHDIDSTAINDCVLGELPGMPARYPSDSRLVKLMSEIVPQIGLNYRIGLIGTGDAFIADKARTEFIKTSFPGILAVEMEAAAIAQVCYQYDTPFVVLRALSDIPEQEMPMTFVEYLEFAAKNSTKMVIAALKALKETPLNTL